MFVCEEHASPSSRWLFDMAYSCSYGMCESCHARTGDQTHKVCVDEPAGRRGQS